MLPNHFFKTADMPKQRRTERLARDKARLSSRNAVFNTYELLEMILLALEHGDILVAAYVSKSFHNLIMSSGAIDKRLASTPFFLLECQQPSASDGKDSQLVHLMFDCADVIVRRINGFEAVAVVRKQPSKPASNERFFIQFLDARKPFPGLGPKNYGILRQGWTTAFKKRLSHYYDQHLLRRLEYAVVCNLLPAKKDEGRDYGSWKDEGERGKDRMVMISKEDGAPTEPEKAKVWMRIAAMRIGL